MSDPSSRTQTHKSTVQNLFLKLGGLSFRSIPGRQSRFVAIKGCTRRQDTRQVLQRSF